jgi:hypothetical protein
MPKSKNKMKELPEEWKHVNNFFVCFGYTESQEQLWQMLKLALTSVDDMGSPEERSALICFYCQTKELIKSSYEVLQQVKKQHGIKPLIQNYKP